MFAEVITIGDELLIGQVVDTNSAWLGKELNNIGVRIQQITSISDSRNAILEALKNAEQAADIVLITGGLGPTKDDITKHVLAEYFNTELEYNEEIYLHVKSFFDKRGIVMAEVNKYQAHLPKSCNILKNSKGTASGMWFERNNTIFVSMPGVPFEMKGLMQEYVLPELQNRFTLPFVVHKTVMTHGIGESSLMEIIENWENSLNEHNIKLAYLPSPARVRLRLSSVGPNKESIEQAIDQKISELNELIPQYIFGFDDEQLESVIGKLLQSKGATVATAESCTGGLIAHLFTSIAGSSNYFMGSVVAYDNAVKQNVLGVSADDLLNHGAVSEEVVKQMALGVKQLLNTDYAIATSGIAGPGGGTPIKPVGTVWIGIATPQGVTAHLYQMGTDREANIKRSANQALTLLRKALL